MRAKAKFASRFKPVDAFKMGAQKYFAFVFSEIDDYLHHPASIAEGRIAIVTKREAGRGGRDGADRRAASIAYGEVVWSWRAYAGAKLVTMPRASRR